MEIDIWKNLPTEIGEEIWLGWMDQWQVCLVDPRSPIFCLIECHIEHCDSEEQASVKDNVIFFSVDLGRDKRRRPIKLVGKAFKEELVCLGINLKGRPG